MILVTSCPECKTTFRISVGILEKAGGQVRCGRCAMIFDANAKLREVDESEVEAKPASPPAFKFELQPDPESVSAADPPEDSQRSVSGDAPAESGGEPALSARDDDAPDDAYAESDDALLGDDDALATPDDALLEADDTLSKPDDAASGAEHIVLETLPGTARTAAAYGSSAAQASPAAHASPETPDWLLSDPEPRPDRTRLWAAGVALATVALVGQLVHHYREDLVAQPAIGPVVAVVYAAFGAELRPSVDLDQYQLRDLTAVAEPSSEDQGWLVIETRVHNSGPDVQPYPHIFVRLLDRWEDTVAARYFAPEEYAVTSIPDVGRMNVGSTIDAQFMIMDPGPSATGFELELCIESTRGFECESDATDE